MLDEVEVWLREHRDEDFLLWIDSFNPHPYANISIPQLHTLPKVLHTAPTYTYNMPGEYNPIYSKSVSFPIVSP